MVVSDSKKEAIETVLKEYDMKEEAGGRLRRLELPLMIIMEL